MYPWEETSPKMSGWKTGRTGIGGVHEALYHDLGDPRDYSHEYYPGQMSDRDDKGINVHMDTTRDNPKDFDKRQRDDKGAMKKSWEVWLDNVTKPIPDSKGGRGSFQHCINANQDKHNPGGWCKQIERKIGKAKKPKKEVKLPQTKIDEPKHWWDHSKVGRNTGWEDNPMNKPSYFFAVMEEERKKKEKKKEKKKIAEKPESDYYMDAGGNPQRKEKTDKCPGCDGEGKKWRVYSWGPVASDCPGCDGRGKLTPTQQQDKDAKEADDKQYKKLTDKTDYFVEEIRANIIYHNKVFPLIGMIAGQAARGLGKLGKKVGSEVLEGAGQVGQHMMEQEAQEEEEQ